MTSKNTCPKCGAKLKKGYKWLLSCQSLINYNFNTEPVKFAQSEECAHRVQVQRLKLRVAKLTERAEAAEKEAARLQRENHILRNPNF